MEGDRQFSGRIEGVSKAELTDEQFNDLILCALTLKYILAMAYSIDVEYGDVLIDQSFYDLKDEFAAIRRLFGEL